MKKVIVQRLCGPILTLGLLVSLTACGSGKVPAASTNSENGSNITNCTDGTNPHGGDDGTGSSDNTGETVPSDSAGKTLSSGNADKTVSSGNAGKTLPSDGKKGSGTQAVTSVTTSGKTNQKTALSVDDVLKKMPAKLKGSTIKFFFWEDLHNTVYKDAVEAFEKKTGITLQTVIGSHGNYATELAALINAGNAPDMVKIIENRTTQIASLQPITNSGYDFHDTGWDEEIMRDFTFNGRVYGANVKDSPNRNMALILYNKKALKRAKLEDPNTIWKSNPKNWTWDKLWGMCDDFLKANGNRDGYYGITFGVEDGYTRSFGASFFQYDTAKGQFVSAMKDANTIKRYETLIDAVYKKWSTSTVQGIPFEQGKVLFNWTYSSMLEKENQSYTSLKENGNLGFVPCPSDSTTSPLFEYCAYGIPVGAKNAEAVPYFLRYVFAPETNKLDNFYLNKEAREVCESIIKKGNFYLGYGYEYSIWQQMISGTSSQVKTVLDSNAAKIEDQCLVLNSQIKSLSK